MKKAYFLIFALLIAGCASVGNIDSQDFSDGIKWKELKQSGVCEEASRNPWVNQLTTEGKTNYFDAQTSTIVWWGMFGPYAFLTATPTFTAKWYDPSGSIFHESTFSLTSMWDNQFYKTVFPMKNLSAAKHPGEWKVEIILKGKVIDRRRFQMGELKPAVPAISPVPTEPVSAAKVAQTKAVVPSPQISTPAQNLKGDFLEKYEKAGAHFTAGQLPEARKELESILNEEPFRSEAHLGLAAISFKEKRWDDCLRELDYLIQNPVYREKTMKVRAAVLELKR